MTSDKARKLIEEGLELMLSYYESGDRDVLQTAFRKFNDASVLLPEWQEFDAKREETWPKNVGDDNSFNVTVIYEGGNFTDQDWWVVDHWQTYGEDVSAYQPLPPPYVKS